MRMMYLLRLELPGPDVAVKTAIVLLFFFVVSSFLLTLIRTVLNYLLKSKMIRKGIVGDDAEKILQSGEESKSHAVRWFLLLLCGGAGLVAMNFVPLGWASAGILAFCLALGYGLYYLYLENKQKDR